MIPIARITSFTSLISFMIGLSTVIATYYEAKLGDIVRLPVLWMWRGAYVCA